jgi:diacylglycerol O-acyltransferase / wax synthase
VSGTPSITRVPVPDLCTLWAETPTAPMNIALIGILERSELSGAGNGDPSAVLGGVRAAVEANLYRTPMLRRLLHRTHVGEGAPIWIDAPAFDITRHVVLGDPESPLPDDGSFLAWCAERSVIPLDRTRPLWRMDVVPGLPGGHVGVLLVLHHVVADGLRGVELVSGLLDPAPRPHPHAPRPWRPEPPPSTAELVRDNLRRRVTAVGRARPARLLHSLRSLRSLRALAREPGGHPPTTFLAGRIRPGRRLTVLRFGLDELRGTAHHRGCTINELLLAGVTQGLRRMLLERGKCPVGLVLRASVPVGAQSGRAGGMVMAPLPVGVPDADAGLRMIVDATRSAREHADAGVAGLVTMPASIARLGILWARHAATSHINLYVTNVPGPPGALYLSDARLLEAVPLAPLVAGVRLSVTALSYDGQFVVSLLADDALEDLPVMAAGLRSALLPQAATTVP